MDLLPLPSRVTPGPGTYTLPPELAISGSPASAAAVRRLLAPGTGLDLPSDADGALVVTEDPRLAAEAYRLEVHAGGIRIEAADDHGLIWATQTLRQLLPPSVLRAAPTGDPLIAPCVHIEDAPRFGWRGVMLDVARHFLPLPQLFGMVDLISAHKHNVLHLHLTDDQGWRFESRRHPRLQEVASWRTETRRPGEDAGDGTPHGGFYTQDQLRSLVTYAAQRGVTVVPELEFPGHVSGVLAAYPELGNHPDAEHATATTFGIFDEVLDVSEATMAVVLDLYDELLDVFPSPYVHVGGDECPRTEWRDLGRADAEQLQRRFTETLRDWLDARGRRLVGWDEIGDDGPLTGAVLMAWRDRSYGIAAAQAGLDVVMAPTSHTYFDYYADAGPDEPYAIGGLVTTEDAYAFDPLAEVPEGLEQRILGTQCQVWTEYLPDVRRLEYALFPRACAHAEVAWSSPEGRSWSEFRPRLESHLDRLDALGVDYRPLAGPRPWQRGGSGRLRREAS